MRSLIITLSIAAILAGCGQSGLPSPAARPAGDLATSSWLDRNPYTDIEDTTRIPLTGHPDAFELTARVTGGKILTLVYGIERSDGQERVIGIGETTFRGQSIRHDFKQMGLVAAAFVRYARKRPDAAPLAEYLDLLTAMFMQEPDATIRIFRSLDFDGDRALRFVEFQHLARWGLFGVPEQPGHDTIPEMLEDLFRVRDADRSGMLSFREAAFQLDNAADSERQWFGPRTQWGTPEGVMQIFDRDRNGRLIPSEWRDLGIFVKHVVPDVAVAWYDLYDATFARVDADRDGGLTRAELGAFLPKRPLPQAFELDWR